MTLSIRQKLILLNIATFVGIGASLFHVPPSTPFVGWAIVSFVVLIVGNVLFFFSIRRKKPSDGNGNTYNALRTMAWFCAALLFLEFLLRYVFHK